MYLGFGRAVGRQNNSFEPKLILGSNRSDTIEGNSRDNVILGLKGDDTIFGGDGSDKIIGGRGFDTAVYSGSILDYRIDGFGFAKGCKTSPLALMVTGVGASADSGRDVLTGIEALYFEGDDYTLYIDGRNNAVLAGDDAVAAVEGTALMIDTAELLANDHEFDGDTLVITAVSATSALGASLSLDNNQITYLAGASFDALAEGEQVTDTFTYIVDDGKGGTDTATVTVTLTGTNDAPVLTVASDVTIDENTTAVTTASATDVDSSTLVYALSGDDAHLFQIDEDGNLSFIAAPDFESPEDADADNRYQVTVTVTDDLGASDSTDLTVTLADVAEGPLSLKQSFETEAVGNRYEAADTNGTTLPIGTVVDLVNVDGLASVDSTEASAGLIGYDLTWENTRGDVGISDGDYIGVQNYTGAVGAFTDGSQGYELSDADGLLRLTFDTIDLSATGKTLISLDAFLQSTGWEADDLINIYVVTDAGTVSLLDSTGQDIDDMGIEGSWMTLSTTLSESVNSAQLVVEFDSNSADEALYFDNVYVGTAAEDTGEPADITLISAIQGTEDDAAMAGESVTVSAIVTHITDTGFYLQEEEADYDADARTSEGIFVYGNTSGLAVGDLVAVSGIVSDYYGMTQLSSVSNIDVLDTGVALPALSTLTLSTDTPIDYEAYEGMLVEIASASATDPLTVIENYNLDRYGEIVIATGTQTQPTQIYDAQTQADEIAALTEANTNSRIVLDDGSSAENPDAFVFIPDNNPDDDNGYLDSGDSFTDAGTTLRLGAELNDTVKGVLNYGFDDWRVTVTETLSIDESTNSGAREASPEDVGGSLQVASYNVLNFFTTIDQGSAGTGPDGTLDPRGADTVEEFERQSAKIVDGILGTGAEVLALQEIENNGSGDGSAVDTLADMVTAAATDGSVFASVDPTGTGGFVGTDAITTGIIYDTTAVTLLHSEYITYEESSADTTYALAESIATAIGATDLLDDLGDYQRNRPSVAATFEDNDTGAVFTVVSSHFKSKGDSGLQAIADAAQDYLDGGGTDITQSDLDAFLSDPNFDQGDGQGFWNGVRSDAAMELAEWIGTEYNGGGVTNVIMLGDLNSYAEDDPVQYLDDTAGFTDLIDTYIGQDTAYSYVFDGQQGTLDQGMADDTLAGYVTGATEWHINADEPDLIGYDNSYTNSDFYNDGVYASSDHDPLIVGLDFNGWVTPLV